MCVLRCGHDAGLSRSPSPIAPLTPTSTPHAAGDDQPAGVRVRDLLFRGNVLWLSLVSLLNDVASEMIYPLLPVFLVSVLGAGPAFLGVIEGIAESTASFLKLASGWISDRVRRRKPLVLWGYGLAGVVRPLVAVVVAPWQLLVIRFADRVGKGLRTAPRDALLAESVAPPYRGRAFGFHRAADHAGALIGPLLATVLLLVLAERLRLVFALAALPGLVGVAVVALRVQESRLQRTPAPATPPVRTLARELGRPMFRYLVVLAIFTLGNATDAFLLLRARGLGVSVALIPLLWAVHNGSKMIWSVPGGALADRLGPRPTIIMGWVVYGLTYAGFAFAGHAWQAWALFVIYGLFYGLTESPEKKLVSSLAPAEQRGSAFGAYYFAIGVTAFPASLLFGALWQGFSPTVAFLTGGVLALLAAALLPLVVRPPQPAS